MEGKKVKILMKRKTLLIIVELILLLIICGCTIIEYNKIKNVKEIADDRNENKAEITRNIIDEDTNVIYEELIETLIETVDVEAIDITTNNKTKAINENVYYYTVMKDGKYGVIDSDGNLVVDAKYESITVIDNKLLYVNKNKIIDLSGNYIADEVIPDEVTGRNIEDRFIFYNNNLKGVKDEKGNVLISAQYNEVDYVASMHIICMKKGEKYSLYNYNGNKIIDNIDEPDYCVGSSGEGDAGVACFIKRNDKKGIYFYKTKVLINPQYYDIKYGYSEPRCVIFVDEENNPIKIYNYEGKEIPLSIYNSDSFEEYMEEHYGEPKDDDDIVKLTIVNENKRYGLEEEVTGKQLLSCIYDKIELEHHGFVVVNLNGKKGFIDAINGKQLRGCIYDEIKPHIYPSNEEERYVIAKIENNFSVFIVDLSSNIKELNLGENIEDVIVKNWNNILVKKNGKWAYVANMAYVTDFIYDEIVLHNYHLKDDMGMFTNAKYGHYIGVLVDNKWGVIDKNGNTVLEPYYEKEYVERLAEAYYQNGVFFVGKWVLSAVKFSELSVGVSTNEDLKTVKVISY